MEDAPPIEAFYHQYTHIYLGQALVGCLLVGALTIIFRPHWRESLKVRCLIGGLVAHVAQALWTCQYTYADRLLTVQDILLLDWVGAFLVPILSWLWMDLMKARCTEPGQSPLPRPSSVREVFRPAIVYLLSSVAIFAYSVPSHLEFWEL